MNPYIFREYEIRGVVDKDFTAGLIHGLGKAFEAKPFTLPPLSRQRFMQVAA